MVTNILAKFRPVVRIAIVLCVILIVSLVIYISQIPEVPGTVIKFTNGALCQKNPLLGWEASSLFSTEDDIFICGSFEVITELGLQQSVLVWVFKEGNNSLTDYEYFRIEKIQEGYQQLPINIYLEPGSYLVEIRSGKRTIFREKMVIKSNE